MSAFGQERTSVRSCPYVTDNNLIARNLGTWSWSAEELSQCVRHWSRTRVADSNGTEAVHGRLCFAKRHGQQPASCNLPTASPVHPLWLKATRLHYIFRMKAVPPALQRFSQQNQSANQQLHSRRLPPDAFGICGGHHPALFGDHPAKTRSVPAASEAIPASRAAFS